MKTRRTKILTCLVWTLLLAAAFSFNDGSVADGQTGPAAREKAAAAASGPDAALVARFDNAMQARFLSELTFGMSRLGSSEARSPHIAEFWAKTEEEVGTVADFEKGGWHVAIYLFGKRTMPQVRRGRETDRFDIRYRLHFPLPVTTGLNRSQLPKADKLVSRVKTAFLDFQTPGGAGESSSDFQIGKWSYFARPVRAVNSSCVTCHGDYVVTAKVGDGQFKIRKRKIGDANGVIVYGFAKKD